MYKIKIDGVDGKVLLLKRMRMPWAPLTSGWFVRKEWQTGWVASIMDKMDSFNPYRRQMRRDAEKELMFKAGTNELTLPIDKPQATAS